MDTPPASSHAKLGSEHPNPTNSATQDATTSAKTSSRLTETQDEYPHEVGELPSRVSELSPGTTSGSPPTTFDVMTGPPPDESTEEQAARLEREQDAKKASDAIDEEIDRARRTKKKPIKLLLLGESLPHLSSLPSQA
jgi:hypothetical protein